MATSARDAQTFLIKVKEKYPQYKDYDDATLFSAIQKKYPQYRDVQMGTIPNVNKLIDSAIPKNPLPFFRGSDVPKVAFQGAQGAVGNAPQNIVENPMMTAMGGLPSTQFKSGAQGITGLKSLFLGGDKIEPESTEFSEQYLEPETVGGKIAGTVANIAGGGFIPGMFAAKGVLKTLFGKQMARKGLPKATANLSESLQKVILKSSADPHKLGVPKNEVIKVLEEGLSKSKAPHGEQKATFQRWISVLKSDKFKSKNMLDADDISQIETAFGKAAKYGKTVNDPILQQSAKGVNRYASQRLDLISEKAGVPEFISRSAEKSKLLRASKAKPNYLQGLIRKVVELGAAGIVGGAIGSKLVPK